MIVTIVAIVENGYDDPDDYMERLIFFLVTFRITAIFEIETNSISTIVVIKWRSSNDREFNGNHFYADCHDWDDQL